MSSFVKYKIREVAKDFDMAPKAVVSLVGEYFEAPKSSAQVLTDEQLNVIFDRITRDNQIGAIEEVFAAAKPDAPEPLAVEETPLAPAPKPAPGGKPQGQGGKPQNLARPQQGRPQATRTAGAEPGPSSPPPANRDSRPSSPNAKRSAGCGYFPGGGQRRTL